MFTGLLVFFVLAPAQAALHAAKRTIGNSCGPSPVDCGNGWCCIAAMKCISSSPPMCEDLLIPSFSVAAAPYSDLDPERLTSLELTISTFPSTTLTATDALPSYSDDETETTTSGSSLSRTELTAIETVVATISTAGAALPTLVPNFALEGIAAAYAGILMT